MTRSVRTLGEVALHKRHMHTRFLALLMTVPLMCVRTFGIVALNMRLCLWLAGGRYRMMASMAGLKPMSSRRSASSITNTCVRVAGQWCEQERRL